MSRLIGADQPFGIDRKLSYRMTADRYTGRVLYVTFKAQADLSVWVPPPLEVADPHAGFLKLYELKRRPETGTPLPPAFSQYHEACITVLAAPPGEVPRHYNLFMWVSHDWAMYKARSALGWPKKLASIAMTRTYPANDRYDQDEGTSIVAVDVNRYGYPIISLRAELDPKAPEQPVVPFNGFYTVRHIPAPVEGDEDLRELLVIETRDGWAGPATYGSAEVVFSDAPDEELSLVGDVEVTGCCLRDVGWVLPAWPARRLMSLPRLDTDMGESKPGG